MFGYLFPQKERLQLCERKIFRNYFCSLCLAQRYCYGRIATLFNNYEIAFLSIVMQAYGNDAADCGRCGKYLPDRKDRFTQQPWSSLADYNVNMIRIKLDDDIQDEYSARAFLLKIACMGIFRKSQKRNRALYEACNDAFKAINDAERSSCGIWEMMDLYASFIEKTIQTILSPDPDHLQLLKAIARWLYWIDAVQDYEGNLKRHCFNPLIQNRKREATQELFLTYNSSTLVHDFIKLKDDIDCAYARCHYAANNRVIIENIIDYTIVDVTKRILSNQPLKKKGRLL